MFPQTSSVRIPVEAGFARRTGPKCQFGGWGGICMHPEGFTLVPVTVLCAGPCTSATLSCGVKMSESSSCIICCPLMPWISSASPTPLLTQVSQLCLSVCFCTPTPLLTQVSQLCLSVCFCTPTPLLTQVSQLLVSVCFCTPTPLLTQVSQLLVSVCLFLYTNTFASTGQSAACVCLSVSVHQHLC